jgi:hypothetical protein
VVPLAPPELRLTEPGFMRPDASAALTRCVCQFAGLLLGHLHAHNRVSTAKLLSPLVAR